MSSVCQKHLLVRLHLPSEGEGGGKNSVGEGEDMDLEPVIAHETALDK